MCGPSAGLPGESRAAVTGSLDIPDPFSIALNVLFAHAVAVGPVGHHRRHDRRGRGASGRPGRHGDGDITLDATKGEACVDFTVADIETATAAHIHVGGLTVAGPIVVDLPVPSTGTAKGCVPADAALVTAIIADPAAYYVNVHNNTYPKGALRAQLGGGPTAAAGSVRVASAVSAHCSLQVV